jgi:hypothetical protein
MVVYEAATKRTVIPVMWLYILAENVFFALLCLGEALVPTISVTGFPITVSKAENLFKDL